MCSVLCVLAFQMLTAASPDLDSLRWHNRVLVAFATDRSDPLLREQTRIVDTHSQGFAEREIKTFGVLGQTPEAKALRLKLHAPEESFAVVLVGKDGSVKLRKESPLSAEELFKTIDQMPMRKQEMEQQR